jgi:hypothetical protein
MRSFRQIISEQLPSDKLDKLTHNIPLSKKRLKKLAGDYSAFEDFDFDSWQSYPFPSNSSKIVIHEIQYLIGLQEFRSQWEKDMIMHDTKVIEVFKNYLEKHELEVDLEPIKALQIQSDPIILSLKRFYNRPRPKELAKKLGLDFSFFPLKTAETPSYPSGHATQGRLVAKLIADEVPFKHRADIIRIGEDMGEGRMIAGAHYPTDTNFGHLLADELYRLAKDPKKSELTLEMTLGAMQQQVADLDSGLEVVSNKRRIGNTGNLTSKQFADKLDKDMGATNIKIIQPLQGKNQSSAFDMFEFEFDGDVYSVHLAGKVARGTTSTNDNETSFLLVLSARQHGAKDEEEDIKVKMIDPKVYSKVGLDKKKAMALVAYMEEQPSWFLSHRKQVNVLIQKLGTTPPKRYIKDYTGYPINQQAKALYKENFNDTLDLDKWNPADIWLEYSSLPTHKTLTDLNNFCYNSIKSVSGIVGVSLKKGSGKLSYINYDKEKEPYDLKKINLKMSKLWALAATIEFEGPGLDGISLGFRIFGGKATDVITGEAEKKGADAVQGKVKLTLLDQFTGQNFKSQITAVGGADILDYNRNTGKYSLTKDGLKKYKKVKTAWTIIKGKNLSFARGAQKNNYNNAFKNEKNFIDMLNKENLPENKGKAVINSRFQTLMLCQIISSMNKKDARKLALQLLKYGKSMSEWSAAHMKLE